MLKQNEPEVQEAIKSAFDDLSGTNTPDLRTFEAMIIVAFKD